MSLYNNLKCLNLEDIHNLFHTNHFESIIDNIYEIKNIQIVHKRRVSKRLYFFDARFYINNCELCKSCQKISFILKYPELEIDTIHNIQKNVKLGDKVKIICWVENMNNKNKIEINDNKTSNTISNKFLFHIKELDIIEKYDSKIAFIPELPIIEKKYKQNPNFNNKNEIENNAININIKNNNENENLNIDNSGEKKGICKFWLNGRNCLRGKDCPFRHINNEELKKQWIDERLNKRKFNFNNKDDFIDPHDKAGHGKRAHIFANWLVEHFGKNFLNSGTGVLDIAGGRGAISFELTINHKIHSTLLEPRPAKLDKKQIRLLHEIKKKEILNDNNDVDDSDINNHDNNNNSIYNNNEIVNNIDEINNNNSKPKRIKFKKNIKYDIPFTQIQCMVDFDTPNHYKELFNDSSILIGLHPDQATEIIVDLAIKLNKPFAIIPCCVFANDFPHRKLKRKKTGNVENDNEYEDIPVSSYEQFIEYLCEKDKDIQKTFLPFE
eukprot:jgi/Orpsp1_1/1190809/evm.model.d7180000081344.1